MLNQFRNKKVFRIQTYRRKSTKLELKFSNQLLVVPKSLSV